jgi:hypothetical protein
MRHLSAPWLQVLTSPRIAPLTRWSGISCVQATEARTVVVITLNIRRNVHNVSSPGGSAVGTLMVLLRYTQTATSSTIAATPAPTPAAIAPAGETGGGAEGGQEPAP